MLVKSVMVFTALMMIIYTFGLWININAQSKAREQILDSVQMQISFIADNLSAEIDNLNKQQINLGSNYSLQMLLFNRTTPMSSVVNNLWRVNPHLDALAVTGNHASDFCVYLPHLNRVVRNGQSYREPPADDLELFAAVDSAAGSVINYGQDIIIGNILVKSNDEQSSALSLVRLSGEKLSNTFRQIASIYNLSVSLYCKDEHVLRVGEGIDGVDPLSVQPNTSYKVNTGRSSYWMLRSSLDEWGLDLVVYLPDEQIASAVIPIIVFTVAMLSFALLGGIAFFTFYINRSFVNPIRKLVVAFNEIEQDNLGVTLDIQEAASTFRYLFTAFNTMTHRLNECRKYGIRRNY